MICEAHDLLLDQVKAIADELTVMRRMIVRSAVATVSALTAVISVLGWVM